MGDVCGDPVVPGKSYCPACYRRMHAGTAARAPFVRPEPTMLRTWEEDNEPDLTEMLA